MESVILYLKDTKRLKYSHIAALIKRDQRNARSTYLAAKVRQIDGNLSPVSGSDDDVRIPISIFADAPLSALEALVAYLKDERSLSYHQIAVLVERDDRTIWTVYQRAKKKHAKQ